MSPEGGLVIRMPLVDGLQLVAAIRLFSICLGRGVRERWCVAHPSLVWENSSWWWFEFKGPSKLEFGVRAVCDDHELRFLGNFRLDCLTAWLLDPRALPTTSPGQAFPSPVFGPFVYRIYSLRTHIIKGRVRTIRGGVAGWCSSARALPDPTVFVRRNLATLARACVQCNLTLVVIARVP
jgi:hypothetical protein